MHYLISLGLTLVLELALALLWPVRRRDLVLVVLVNLLTNPLVVLAHGALAAFDPWLHTLLPELWALATEALLYCRLENRIRWPALFAPIANGLSYTMGLLLQSILQTA